MNAAEAISVEYRKNTGKDYEMLMNRSRIGVLFAPKLASSTNIKGQAHLCWSYTLVESTPGLQAITKPLWPPDIRRKERSPNGAIPIICAA